jgi:hypothetical protein
MTRAPRAAVQYRSFRDRVPSAASTDLGPLLDYVKTRTDSGRIIEDADPYGAGRFGQ